MRRRRVLLLSAALLLIAALSAGSQESGGDPADPDAPPTIPVPVYLGPRYLGEIDAIIGDGDEVLVPPADVLSLLEDRLVERVLVDATRLLPGNRPVAPEAFAPLGLTVGFDWNELLLRVDVPPLIQRPREIALTGRRSVPDGDAVAPADVSVIVNLDLVGRYSYESVAFDGAATPELAASVFGVVLEAQGGVRTGDAPLFLDHVRLSRDLPRFGYRVQAGDLTWRAVDLHGVSRITGLSLFREGSLGSPIDRRAEVMESIYLPGSSEVVVTMNEAQVYRRTLEPGNYEVGSAPYGDGINTVVMSWEDDDGPREVEVVVPHDTDLLPRGELDAGLAAGVADRVYSRPVVAAYQRYGLARGLTVGLRQGVEILDFQVDLGADTLLATRLGTFALEPTFGLGPAGRVLIDVPLRYYYLDSSPSSYLSFGVSGGYRSVTAPGAGTAASTVTAAGYASFAFADGFSVTPRISDTYAIHDGTNVLGVRASLRKALRGGSALSADVGFTYDGEPAFSATVTYAAAFPARQQNLLVRQDLASQELFAFWSRYPGTGEQDLDLSVATKVPIDTTRVANLSGQVGYTHRLFQTGLAHGLGGIVSTGSLQNTTSASFRSALVLADGVLAVSAPVSDSFALVVPGESLADARLLVNRTAGRSDLELQGRPGVLTGLSSHTPLAVDVEPAEMILGLDESALRYVVEPSYRSGTVIRVEPPRNIYAGGVLLDRDEEPLAYRLGVWRSDAGVQGEFFTDQEGYFEMYGLEPGTYELLLAGDEELRFVATIPQDANEYVNLDEIRAEERP